MKISNEKHAAVILKCLPRATADRFLEALDPESCSSVIHLMKNVDVTTEKLQAAIACLERAGLGGFTDSEEVDGDRPHGDRNVRLEDESPFAFLYDVESSVLHRLFREEQSRNAAAILSTLKSDFVSSVLRVLEPPKRVGIVRHIASLTELDKKEIIELRFSLKLRIQRLRKKVKTELQTMTEPESVKESRPYETLHELSELSNKQIKTLLKRIDTSHLAPALKTLPIQLQRKVLRNMASKPAAIVSREIVDVRVDEKHRIERSSHSVARAIKELKKQ